MANITQQAASWHLDGDVVFAHASQLLKDSLSLNLHNAAIVDFANVADVDTSALSLMLEWERRAIAEQKKISYINLPANLLSLAKLYDVESLIV